MTDTDTRPAPVAIDGTGLYAGAAHVVATAAARLDLTPAEVEHAMLLSAWTTVAEMIEREFLGAYRSYYPKCSMSLRAEAVIAEVFDAIAAMQGDPRRALRGRHVGAGGASATEGRTDG